MKILAIDTATQVASIAVLSEDKLISENIIDYKLKHSQKLMLSLENLMESIEMTYKDLDYLAVAIGPGSFTGLRIGLSTVKALAQATSLPVIPVSTLESLAYNLYYSNGIICPVLDARRNQVYTALFESSGGKSLKRLIEDQPLNLEDLNNKLIDYEKPIYILGDGAEKFKNELLTSENRTIVKPYLRACHAASVATVALDHLEDQTDYLKLSPSYLRPSYAEE